MLDIDLIELLKMSLEIDETFMDEEAKRKKDAELNQYINSAQEFLKIEGVRLDLDDYAHVQLIVLYAEWLYEKRKGLQSMVGQSKTIGSQYPGPMPRALKRNINNILFQQKAEED